MRALAAAALVVAAACADSPPPPTTNIAHDTTPAHRDSAAPHVEWGSDGFVVGGLPAIAAAGEVVLLAVLDRDTHTGPALRVEVRDADDHVIQMIDVLAASEVATMVQNGVPTDALTARIAAANHTLETLHGVHDLKLMQPLAVEAGHDGEDQHWATGHNLDVEWRDHHLRVFRHNVTQPLADRDGAHWVASPSGPCAGRNPPFLGAIYHAMPGTTHAAGGNAVLVQIDFHGDDTCAEPPPELHVISWAGVSAR